MHADKPAAPAPGDILELEIEKPAFGGQALARLQGLAVFVDHGLPGQRVRARVVKTYKNRAEAALVETLAPGPDQVEPFCPHFLDCGGCAWQDLAYEAQLSWKRILVREQLERIGRIKAEPGPTIPSPARTFFRNKMEFAFGPGRGESLSLGLRRSGSDRVVDVETCFLQTRQTPAIVNRARELARASGIAAFDPASRRGFWRFLVIREFERTNQAMLHLITGPTSPEKGKRGAMSLLTPLLEEFPQIKGAVHSIRRHPTQRAIGERQVLAMGRTRISERLAGLEISVSAEGFSQTNTGAAELLYAKAGDMAGLSPGAAVWDLYCGGGGLGLSLAGRDMRLTGFDIGRDSIRDARFNAEQNNLDDCEFVEGDLARTLNNRSDVPDAVFVDPPRSGLSPEVLESLIRIGPPKIVYISCNPATQARDAAGLAEEYGLAACQPLDMFPHSPHIENIILFERK